MVSLIATSFALTLVASPAAPRQPVEPAPLPQAVAVGEASATPVAAGRAMVAREVPDPAKDPSMSIPGLTILLAIVFSIPATQIWCARRRERRQKRRKLASIALASSPWRNESRLTRMFGPRA